MSGEARLWVRRALSRAQAAAGTPAVAVGLTATAVLFHVATAVAARVASDAAADALATSPAFAILCAAMLLDGATGFLRETERWASRRAGSPRPPAARIAAPLLLRSAYALLAVGLTATLLARDESRIWVAVGEPFAGEPGQYLSRMPPRPMSSGSPRIELTVVSVDPGIDRDGRMQTLSARLVIGAREVEVSRIRPAWLGWASFLRSVGFGYAPLLELGEEGGAPLDGAFVKLRLLPRGARDHYRPVAVPHRIYFEIPPEAVIEGGAMGPRSLSLRAEVWRGKVPIAEGPLGGDAHDLRFEGLVLRMPEVRYWVEFALVHDPGIPLVVLAGVAAAAGAAASVIARRRRGGSSQGSA